MIHTSKKSILVMLLVTIALFNIFAIPALATSTEVAPMETVTVQLLSEDGEVLATFNSQEEFEIYMAGVSPAYETCGDGLYWHGQYTYTVESLVKITSTDSGGTTILYLIYVEVFCSSCNGLIETYYLPA